MRVTMRPRRVGNRATTGAVFDRPAIKRSKASAATAEANTIGAAMVAHF